MKNVRYGGRRRAVVEAVEIQAGRLALSPRGNGSVIAAHCYRASEGSGLGLLEDAAKYHKVLVVDRCLAVFEAFFEPDLAVA